MKDQGQVLLANIDYGDGKIVWNGISGYVELDEEREDAAVREVREEIGIEVEKSSLQYKGNHILSEELDLEVFVATKWSGIPASQEESIKKLQWFAIGDLPFEEMFPDNKEWVLEFLK